MFSFFIYRKDIKLCEEQNHHYRKRLCIDTIMRSSAISLVLGVLFAHLSSLI